MAQFNRYTQNKLISKFSVDFDVSYYTIAQTTMEFYMLTSGLFKFGDYFTKQMNLQELFSTKTLCT